MPKIGVIKKEYESVSTMREGAHFCRMDLHTHTPASECSSFSLPPQIDAVINKEKKNSPVWYKHSISLLDELLKNRNPFSEAYADPTLESRPRLDKRPDLNQRAMQNIADYWIKEIKAKIGALEVSPSSPMRKEWEKLIKGAVDDLRHYLESLFFLRSTFFAVISKGFG